MHLRCLLALSGQVLVQTLLLLEQGILYALTLLVIAALLSLTLQVQTPLLLQEEVAGRLPPQ
jgi:hypothetical protein